jgi:hypothetical protein
MRGNDTRNQHFVSQVEQNLNALNPASRNRKFRIYSFRITDRENYKIELESPRGHLVSSTLSMLDLFSFDVPDGSRLRMNLEELFHKYEENVEVHTKTLIEKLLRGSRGTVKAKNGARILPVSGDHNTPSNQQLPPAPLMVLGKYTHPLPYVIARKMRGPLSRRPEKTQHIVVEHSRLSIVPGTVVTGLRAQRGECKYQDAETDSSEGSCASRVIHRRTAARELKERSRSRARPPLLPTC